MRARDLVRQAIGPVPGETWPAGRRVRYLWIGRLVLLPITMLGNLSLWSNLRGAPGVRDAVADQFIVLNNGLLLLDLLLAIVFLRRAGRAYATVTCLCGALEIISSVIWIQMTGTATSYFLTVPIAMAILYRVFIHYWAGLACFVVTTAGLILAYVLEDAGVLARSSMFTVDVGAGVLPDVYRSTAMISTLVIALVAFTGGNFLVRSLLRGEAALAEARAELAAVVEEARLGRLSGARIARYQLGELIGRGGMGEVYEARRDDGRAVALKLLHAHLGADETARARLRREASLVQRLPAAITAPVLEVGTTGEGADFIAMERLRGEDLGALLRRRGRISADETAALVRAIADAVEPAHAAGVVHRDLKPSNVFLVDGEVAQVRLLDFGVARLYEAPTGSTLTESGLVLGSPGYLAPEQAVGDTARVGPRTDVFAIAAIAYRALTGEAPFPSRTPAQAIWEALHHKPPPPSEVVPELPRAIDAVLAAALAKSMEGRYATARELADDLARACAGQAVRLPQPAEAFTPTLSMS